MDIQKTAYLRHFSAFYEKTDCHIYCPKMTKVPVTSQKGERPHRHFQERKQVMK